MVDLICSYSLMSKGVKKIEIIAELYGYLLKDALVRKIYCRQFYNLSESDLLRFKIFQGFDWDTIFSGAPLEQAYKIWNQLPLPVVKFLLETHDVNSNELVVHIGF